MGAFFMEIIRYGFKNNIIFLKRFLSLNFLNIFFKIFSFLRIVSPNQHVAATFSALSNNSIQQHVPRLTCSQHFDLDLARGVFSLFRRLSTLCLAGLSRLTGFLRSLSLARSISEYLPAVTCRSSVAIFAASSLRKLLLPFHSVAAAPR